MEDVNISKFRAQVVRAGSTPASPGFVVSEGQNPVDPSGSGQNHLPVTIATAATGLSITESQVLGGAGTVGQYIRGDGSLADFPATTGGGSSVSYYLNGSVSQGTIGGVAYREVNRTPIFGAGTDITTSSNGYIANFITDAGDPNKLLIPAGNWNLETYFSANSGGGSPTFYVELYKYNGTTFTLIATSSGTPELIAFGTNINPYFTTLAVPETVLALTDRLALRYYVNTSGRTITLHTEDNHLCQVITTFTTGLTALNGLTNQVQFFAVGTSGTDFAISSATDTHTFNLPTASATNRGALSSADWTTFNNKTSNLGTVTSVGLSSATSGVTIGSTPITTSGTITLAIATASGSQNGLLSSTDWTTFNGKQNALTNPVTGTGTSGQVAYFTGTSAISSESNLFWDATNDRLGIGTNTPATTLEVNGVGLFTGGSLTGNTKNGIYIYDTVIVSLAGGNARALQIQALTLSFFTGATYTEKLKVFENGNVVISTSPSDAGFKLDVNGTGRFTSNLTASLDIRCNGNYRDYQNESLMTTNGSVNEYGSSAAATPRSVSIFAGNTAVLNILTSGSVLIGTQTNPYSLGSLVINHTSTLSRTYFQRGVNLIEIAPSDGSSANIISSSYTISGSAYRPLAFSARQNSADLYLTTGGNVLIGTTTDNGVGKLQISGGSITVAGGVRFSSSGADANRWSVYWNGGTGDLIVVNNISDIRAKKDFDYDIKGLETIQKLKPLKFTWKDGTSHSTSVSGRLRQYGFIAQETMAADDYLAWYNQNQDTWGIEQYESFSAVIVKAIQEQQEIINDLKLKIG
jgi:hypothetical protein